MLGEKIDGLKMLGEKMLGAYSAERRVRSCGEVRSVYACVMSLKSARS